MLWAWSLLCRVSIICPVQCSVKNMNWIRRFLLFKGWTPFLFLCYRPCSYGVPSSSKLKSDSLLVPCSSLLEMRDVCFHWARNMISSVNTHFYGLGAHTFFWILKTTHRTSSHLCTGVSWIILFPTSRRSNAVFVNGQIRLSNSKLRWNRNKGKRVWTISHFKIHQGRIQYGTAMCVWKCLCTFLCTTSTGYSSFLPFSVFPL